MKGKKALIREVKPFGDNGAHVVLPKKLIGKWIKINETQASGPNGSS